MSEGPQLHLFDGFGVEIEYMIVDARSLDVRPICDEVLKAVAGDYECEIELGEISCSNELALHVIELKTSGPANSLAGLPDLFQQHVGRINELLAGHNARLLPSAMHPWMDPHAELQLWPHDYNPVYEAFHRIFDCRGHGWANLQSVHLNLPFADDDEFARLHSAIRLLLPIMPGLSASSPVRDGQVTGLRDTRLDVYRRNQVRVPSISGQVVPEAVSSRSEYEERILRPMWRDIAPHDPDGTLQFEWLNARGAIARFDRHAIEIRVLDVQECPLADVAVCAAIASVLRALTEEKWSSLKDQQSPSTERLAAILTATTRDAEETQVTDEAYLRVLGCKPGASAGDLWRSLLDQVDFIGSSPQREAIDRILDSGTLSTRIVKTAGSSPSRDKLAQVYASLAGCLAEGKMFGVDG